MIKKPTLRIQERQPRNIQRADIAPANGYAMVVDGNFKKGVFERKCRQKGRIGTTGKLFNAANRNLRHYGEELGLDEVKKGRSLALTDLQSAH